MHGRVRLDRAGGVDRDRADLADPPEIVAHEVNDHGQFGGVLRAADQRSRILALRSRPLDRSREDAPRAPIEIKEELRTHRNDGPAGIGLDVSAEPCPARGEGPRRKRTRRAAEGAGDATGDVGLEEVAVMDQAHAAVDRPLERCAVMGLFELADGEAVLAIVALVGQRRRVTDARPGRAGVIEDVGIGAPAERRQRPVAIIDGAALRAGLRLEDAAKVVTERDDPTGVG